ncbi:undecaprenyl-diphosphatase UppP [Candidatus Saccharibacteria bacterium]|nr:undecaprenyl-diphosphatase UppP [Candidatus Saccharibacteria bacterium]
MTILEAIILGLVQGLTEFIPVSSSGHLVLLHSVFGLQQDGLAFDVALHIGTLLALCIFFYKDIILLIQGILGRNDHKKLAWLIAAATIPAVIGGALLQNEAETSFRSVTLVAINLIVVALLMLAAERYAKNHYKSSTSLKKIRPVQAMAIGFAQVIALIPGVSRSGSTITTGIFVGLDRVAATRFSFLLAIPITFGAIAKTMLDGGGQQLSNELGIVLVGIRTAFVSGLFAIRFLIQYLAKHDLSVFAYYRILLGVLVLATVAFR